MVANSPSVSPQPPAVKKPGRSGRFILIIIISFVGGILGGLVGIFAVNDYFSLTGDRGRQVILEESSAVIEVGKKLNPSVVSISTQDAAVDIFGGSGVQEGAGTGIVISEDSLILTNKHVIPEGTDAIRVITNDGREFTDAKVLARDPLLDLAYVKVNGNGFKPAELGDSDQVVVGQRVVAI